MIIDFHSHIMPSFGDGAADEATAIEMLKKSLAQGVDTVVSTSHCYPMSGHDIDSFIYGRNDAYERLKAAAKGEELPKIVPGCEVHLTCDLTKLRGIRDLCVQGTSYIMIEMPVRKWTDEMIDNVYKLSISGMKPVIVHDERNMGQTKEMLDALHMLDVLIQINAESFAMPAYRRYIDGLMKNKLVHLVGTDMHNLTSRAPNMERARRSIIKRYGEECWEYLMHNAEKILEGREISYRSMHSFKKLPLLGRKKKDGK